MRESIRAAIEGGMPTYAECGGLMYLTRSISYRGAAEGAAQEMVGVIPADSVMDDRPQGRGLVRVEPTADFPWPEAGAARSPPMNFIMRGSKMSRRTCATAGASNEATAWTASATGS